MRKNLSGITLTLLLIATLIPALNIQPVKAEGGSSTWKTQTVDSAGNVGLATSLAFDFYGNPAISYGDLDNHDLKFARWDGASWNIQTVDTFGTKDPNLFYAQTSLAFDSLGNPAISYYDGYPYYDLKYAHWNGVNWDIQIVFDDGWGTGWTRTTSLAFDKNGNPAIVFRHMYVGLRYAHWDGTSWNIETVDSGYGTGSHCSLRFDAIGNPAIAYYWQGVYEGPTNLRYAYFNGISWNIEIIDNVMPYSPSLAFDSSGNPAISYYDQTNKNLKHAHWNGVSWSIQVVDTGGVGAFSSLAFNPSDNPAISYYDLTNGDLKFAHFDGSKWNIEAIDSQGDVGQYTSLAFSPSGEPAISYYDATNGDLKYAQLKIVVPEIVFRPPYRFSSKSGWNESHLRGRASYYSKVDPSAGTGRIMACARASYGGDGKALAVVTLGDYWRNDWSGTASIEATFNISDLIMWASFSFPYKSTKVIRGVTLKASLWVYDHSSSTEIWRKDLLIYNRELELISIPGADSVRYRDNQYVIQGLIDLQRDHEYSWHFEARIWTWVIVSGFATAGAGGNIRTELIEVHIGPPK